MCSGAGGTRGQGSSSCPCCFVHSRAVLGEDGDTVGHSLGQARLFVFANWILQIRVMRDYIGPEVQLARCLFCVGPEDSLPDKAWSPPLGDWTARTV